MLRDTMHASRHVSSSLHNSVGSFAHTPLQRNNDILTLPLTLCCQRYSEQEAGVRLRPNPLLTAGRRAAWFFSRVLGFEVYSLGFTGARTILVAVDIVAADAEAPVAGQQAGQAADAAAHGAQQLPRLRRRAGQRAAQAAQQRLLLRIRLRPCRCACTQGRTPVRLRIRQCLVISGASLRRSRLHSCQRAGETCLRQVC